MGKFSQGTNFLWKQKFQKIYWQAFYPRCSYIINILQINREPTGRRKCAQHHWSQGICKSKSQWDITLTPLRMAVIKRQAITSVGKDVEKRQPLCTVGGNVNWCNHYGKKYGGSLKTSKVELPYNLAFPLLSIHSRKITH